MAIFVKIQGGLGNQMFQYAFGQQLSLKLQQAVYYDLSVYKNSINSLALSQLNVKLTIARQKEIDEFFSKKNRALNKIFYNTTLNNKLVHFEKNLTFYKVPYPSNGSAYYEGYWQSEDYFFDIKKKLQSDFALPNNLPTHALTKEIDNQNSIALHIRRNDYLKPEIQKIHGILPKEYYDRAIKIIQQQIPNAKFYIFSDDQTLSSNEFKLDCDFLFTKTTGLYSDVETLILMSQCKHQIIANSTFSWWAAWLNQNPNKQVIAPINWFTNTIAKSLTPKNWNQI